MFSRACEYAIQIMIFISSEQKKERVGLKEITRALGSPEAFTAKILQQLVKHKLLDSYKGPTGGFSLKKDKVIRLIDIVQAIDGNKILEDCILGYERCSSDNPCPIHHKFSGIRSQIKEVMLSIDLEQYAQMK